MKTALIMVDMQNDFAHENGSLSVSGGLATVAAAKQLAPLADVTVATRDWHPHNHSSFKPLGPWPPHCVAGDWGAELLPGVAPLANIIVDKATEVDKEALSGFDGTTLATRLHEEHVNKTIIVGIATEYCVAATALGALAAGFEVVVVTDGIASIDSTQAAKVLQSLSEAGIELATTREIVQEITGGIVQAMTPQNMDAEL